MANVNLTHPTLSSNGSSISFDFDAGTWGNEIVVDTSAISLTATYSGYVQGVLQNNLSKSYDLAKRAEISDGKLVIPVRQSLFVGNTDVSITIGQAAISDGVDENNSFTGSVVNNSTEDYLLPILRFAGFVLDRDTLLWDRSVISETFKAEASTVTSYGIDTVEFEFTDGTNTETYTAPFETRSFYQDRAILPDSQFERYAGGLGVYSSPSIDPTNFNDGIVTLTIRSYPKHGDTPRVEVVEFKNNTSGTLTSRFTWADENASAGGDGSESSPFQTFDEALEYVAANSPDTHIDTVYFNQGRYELTRVGPPYITTSHWVTCESAPSVNRDDVIFYATSNQPQVRIRNQRYKNVTLDIS